MDEGLTHVLLKARAAALEQQRLHFIETLPEYFSCPPAEKAALESSHPIKIGRKARLGFHFIRYGLTEVPVAPYGDSGSLTRFQRFCTQSARNHLCGLWDLVPISLLPAAQGCGCQVRSPVTLPLSSQGLRAAAAALGVHPPRPGTPEAPSEHTALAISSLCTSALHFNLHVNPTISFYSQRCPEAPA